MPWELYSTQRRSRTYRDSLQPNKKSLTETIAPLHYESVIDSGEYDTLVDFTPERITAGGYDGWRVQAADWTYFLGQPAGQVTDGWLGFGGRQGQNVLWSRLLRVGYLRWTNRTWFDLGGAPDYNRDNLGRQTETVTIGDDTVNIALTATWSQLWTTPGGGDLSAVWQADGDRLKELIRINQAGRDYAATQYPGGAQANHYFGFVFDLDLSDIAGLLIDDIPQTGDFNDSNGTKDIVITDALNRALGVLPVSDCWIEDANGDEVDDSRLRLQKRIWLDPDGHTYLLIGARVDQLNALPAGTLVFDPTIDAQIGASAGDSREQAVDGAAGIAVANYRMRAVGDYTAFMFAPAMDQGVTIDTAHLTNYFNSAVRDNVNFTIYANDVDSAATLVTVTNDISTRTPTTATVSWVNGDVTAGTVGFYNSPEIKTVIQEIVDRGGWVSGNNLCLIYAVASACDGQIIHYDGNSSQATSVHIEYTEGGGPVEQSVGGTLSTAGAINRQPRTTKTGSLSNAGVLSKFLDYSAIAGTISLSGQPFLRPAKSGGGDILTTGNLARDVSTSVNGSLSPAGTVQRLIDRSIAGTLSVAGVVYKQVNRLVNGTLSTAGTLGSSLVISQLIAGTLSLAGSLTRMPAKSLTGTLSIAGTVQKLIDRSISGALSISGNITRQIDRTLSGALGLAGIITRLIDQSTGGSISFTAEILRQPQKAIGGTLTTTGSIVSRFITKTVAGVLSLAGSLSSESSGVIQQAVGGVLSFAGIIAKDIDRTIPGSLGLVGQISRLIGQNMGGSMSFIAEILRQPQKAITGGLSTVGSIEDRSIAKSIAGTLAATGSITKRLYRTVTGALSLAGALSIAQVVFQAVGGALSFVGSIVRQPGKNTTGSIGPSGSIGPTFLSRSLTAVLSPVGSITKLIGKLVEGTLPTGGTVSGSQGGTFVQAVSGVLSFVGTVTYTVLTFISGVVYGPDSTGEVDGPGSVGAVDSVNSSGEVDDN